MVNYTPSNQLMSKAKEMFPDETPDQIVNGILQIKQSLPPEAGDDEILSKANQMRSELTRVPSSVPEVSPQPDLRNQVVDKYSEQARESLLAKQQEDSSGPNWRAGLAALGAGISGRDASAAGQGVLEQQNKRRADELNQFDIGRKLQQDKVDLSRKNMIQGREDAAYNREESRIQRESDPMSEESRLAQSLAKRMAPSMDFSKMSASQINERIPSLTKIYDIEQKKLDRQESRSAAAAARSEKATEKATEKGKLSAAQVGEVSSHDKAIAALDDVMAQKKNWDTGKLSMGLNKIAGMVGLDDAEKSAFKSSVGEQLAGYIKQISGATVSPTERASLLENVPSVYDNDDTFEAKAQALKKRLERNRQIEIDNLGKSGKNVEEFRKSQQAKREVKRQKSPSTGKTKIIYDDGSEEIV